MEKAIEFTARLIQAGIRAYGRKWSFLAVFFVIFCASTILLGRFDLLPDVSTAAASPVVAVAETASTVSASTTSVAALPEFPTKIEIPAIKLSATISNPTTTDISVLDEALLSGAVRYPTSAKLGETGNIVVFGHSSYLPVVNNQAYKTFDGIQKLAVGDLVMVSSSDTSYTYRVQSVAKESANDAVIPLAVTGRVLTLATCNSFGAKTDRFVVTADFVESHPISTSVEMG